MIAEGQVAPDHVAYNDLPWKYAAGTPNILGVIVSAQALRLVLDLVLGGDEPLVPHEAADPSTEPSTRRCGGSGGHTPRADGARPGGLQAINGLTVYGPLEAAERSPLVAFNVGGVNPMRPRDPAGPDGRRGPRRVPLRDPRAP